MYLFDNKVLTTCGAFCSGMGVGLLSLSKLELNMMKHQNDEFEKITVQQFISL